MPLHSLRHKQQAYGGTAPAALFEELFVLGGRILVVFGPVSALHKRISTRKTLHRGLRVLQKREVLHQRVVVHFLDSEE